MLSLLAFLYCSFVLSFCNQSLLISVSVVWKAAAFTHLHFLVSSSTEAYHLVLLGMFFKNLQLQFFFCVFQYVSSLNLDHGLWVILLWFYVVFGSFFGFLRFSFLNLVWMCYIAEKLQLKRKEKELVRFNFVISVHFNILSEIIFQISRI